MGQYKGVIFDLDGVIVSTDRYHADAWRQLATELQIEFDMENCEKIRGVSRMESLDIVLAHRRADFNDEQKLELANLKNRIYQQALEALTAADILPGVTAILDELDRLGIKSAVGSSSKNARLILDKIELTDRFAVIVDGAQIILSKPNPQVFLAAAENLGLSPSECVVIEDAAAGIEAALSAGCRAVAVGYAARFGKAHLNVESLSDIDLPVLLEL